MVFLNFAAYLKWKWVKTIKCEVQQYSINQKPVVQPTIEKSFFKAGIKETVKNGNFQNYEILVEVLVLDLSFYFLTVYFNFKRKSTAVV